MTIRRANMGDCETLVSLSIETFTETFGYTYPPEDLAHYLTTTYTPEAYGETLADDRYGIWLAEVDGDVVGYVMAGPCGLPHDEVGDGDGEIKRLYVRSAYQGRGIGVELLETALAWAKGEYASIWLGVWSENTGAQRLYQRYGFTHVGDYHFVVGQTRDHEYIYRLSTI